MGSDSKKLIEDVMKKTGLNISQLAGEVSKHRGKKMYRQSIQRFLNGGGMNLQTASDIKNFSDSYRKKGSRK